MNVENIVRSIFVCVSFRGKGIHITHTVNVCGQRNNRNEFESMRKHVCDFPEFRVRNENGTVTSKEKTPVRIESRESKHVYDSWKTGYQLCLGRLPGLELCQCGAKRHEHTPFGKIEPKEERWQGCVRVRIW